MSIGRFQGADVSLHDLIEEFVGDDDEPDAHHVARMVLARLVQDQETAVRLLTPLVTAAVTNRWRIATARVEKVSALVSGPIADPMADRQAFLAERFYVPDVGLVTWEEATVAHHEARIAFLSKQIDGMVQTVTRHQEAVSLIRGTRRAKNLRDVYQRQARQAS